MMLKVGFITLSVSVRCFVFLMFQLGRFSENEDTNFYIYYNYMSNKINDFSIISLGQACRLCQYLIEYNIRTESFPFDWLRMYNLNIIFDFIKMEIILYL